MMNFPLAGSQWIRGKSGGSREQRLWRGARGGRKTTKQTTQRCCCSHYKNHTQLHWYVSCHQFERNLWKVQQKKIIGNYPIFGIRLGPFVKFSRALWICGGPEPQALGPFRAGLGFSRPKSVFPVQNGINCDKPVFPSFPVQNWEKLSKTGKNYQGIHLKPEKVSKNVMYEIKI